MGIESSAMIVKSFFLFFLSIWPLCVKHGWQRKLYTNKHGSIRSPSSGISLTIIMSQSDRRMYLDVAVKRETECNTNHQFVCMKIRFAGGCHRRKEMVYSDGIRYDVFKLVSGSRAEEESNQAMRMEIQKQVGKRAGAAWPNGGGVDEKLTAVSGPLLSQLMSWRAR